MYSGKNLADLIRLAPRLGVSVAPVRRTGELRFSHPQVGPRPRVNGRRKDAPRALTEFFTQVQRIAASPAARHTTD